MRAEATREREELRADLRARAERAERQADAYRDELDRLRVASHDAPTANGSSAAGVKTTRRAAPPSCLTPAIVRAGPVEAGARHVGLLVPRTDPHVPVNPARPHIDPDDPGPCRPSPAL